MIPATLIWRDGTQEHIAIERAAEGPTETTTVTRDGVAVSFRRIGMEASRFVYEQRETLLAAVPS